MVGVDFTKVTIGSNINSNTLFKPAINPNIVPNIIVTEKEINALDNVLPTAKKKSLSLIISRMRLAVFTGEGSFNSQFT